MSNLVPRETIDAVRNMVDVSLDIAGIDCTLYIPTSGSSLDAEKLDIYSDPTDLIFTSYSTKVYIEWTPNIYKLRKLGLFTEGTLPLIAWFGNKATALEGSEAGEEVDIDIILGSYLKINPEFIPSNYQDVEEFQIVNIVVRAMHDAVLVKAYAIAPRRVKQ